MTEINLTDGQINVILNLKKSKIALQKEINKLSQRETECLFMILESNGVVLTKDNKIELKDNKLVIE